MSVEQDFRTHLYNEKTITKNNDAKTINLIVKTIKSFVIECDRGATNWRLELFFLYIAVIIFLNNEDKTYVFEED